MRGRIGGMARCQMDFEFRFLLICEKAYAIGERTVLENIFSIVEIPDDEIPCDVQCNAVVSCALRPEMYGKQLGLLAWKLNGRRERETLPGWIGVKLPIPEGTGPVILPY